MGLVARSTWNLKPGSRSYLLHYTFLSGLTVVDMEDLLEDIQVHMELEQGKNVDFWQDSTTITENETARPPGPASWRPRAKGQASAKRGSTQRHMTSCRSSSRALRGISMLATPTSPWTTGRACFSSCLLTWPGLGSAKRQQNALWQKLFKPKQEQGVLFSILKSELEELPPSSGPSVDPVEPEGAPATRGGSPPVK